jgi:hypothetical protein
MEKDMKIFILSPLSVPNHYLNISPNFRDKSLKRLNFPPLAVLKMSQFGKKIDNTRRAK